MAAEPTANLKDRAENDLKFIRDAMGRGAAFTCVPGRGGVAMGAVGAVASVLAPRTDSPRAWLAVWVAAGILAFGIGFAARQGCQHIHFAVRQIAEGIFFRFTIRGPHTR